MFPNSAKFWLGLVPIQVCLVGVALPFIGQPACGDIRSPFELSATLLSLPRAAEEFVSVTSAPFPANGASWEEKKGGYSAVARKTYYRKQRTECQLASGIRCRHVGEILVMCGKPLPWTRTTLLIYWLLFLDAR